MTNTIMLIDMVAFTLGIFESILAFIAAKNNDYEPFPLYQMILFLTLTTGSFGVAIFGAYTRAKIQNFLAPNQVLYDIKYPSSEK